MWSLKFLANLKMKKLSQFLKKNPKNKNKKWYVKLSFISIRLLF